MASLARHWTGASACSAKVQKFIQCSALARTGTGNVIPGSDKIPGSRNTVASATKESSSHKVWGVWKTPAFSAFNIAKETLFIDLTLCENGNCEENGSLTIVTAWHLHACSLFPTGDWCELDRRNSQDWQDIEPGHMFVFQHGKICSKLSSFLLGTRTTMSFLVTTRFLEAVTQQHQQPRLLPAQGLRCFPNSSFLSFQHCQGDTLHWSDPLRK